MEADDVGEAVGKWSVWFVMKGVGERTCDEEDEAEEMEQEWEREWEEMEGGVGEWKGEAMSSMRDQQIRICSK